MNIFDLENHVINLRSVVDSLNDISYGILEGDFTKDDTVNAVDGLAVLTKAKIDKLLDFIIQHDQMDNCTPDNHVEWN